MHRGNLALEELLAGNKRAAEGNGTGYTYDRQKMAALTSQQAPKAVVLGCSDSRVPLELVFDQGLGDLFVIRTAGAIAARSQIASVEFAVSALDVPLVLVLGHTRCGAVQATLDSINKTPEAGQNTFIQDTLRPVIENMALDTDDPSLRAQVQETAKASAQWILEGSPVVAKAIAEQRVALCTGVYELETGLVRLSD